MTETLDLPGRRLAYRVDGPPGAPVLVLGGSLGSTAAMWDPQVPVLSRSLRVVRYDHRGHGGSRPAAPPTSLADLGADVVALLDHLGVRRAALGGVSLGGMVAMWVARHHPERVESLALVCTSARLGPPEAWRERAATVRSQGMAAIADGVLARWFTPGWAERHSDVVARLREDFLAVDPDGYAGCCEAIGAMDLLDDLARVTVPTLVVAGADDPATPPVHAEAIAARVPGARLVVVPDAAHLGSVEQPAAVTALLAAHVSGALGGAAAADVDDAYAAGLAVRRQVLGDAHVDSALAGRTPLTTDFQDFITRFAWGGIWTRPGLDRRMRSAVTLGVLVALGHDHELGMHVRAALRNGLTREEVAEVLLQTTVYCGAPAANRAFAVLRQVLESGDEG